MTGGVLGSEGALPMAQQVALEVAAGVAGSMLGCEKAQRRAPEVAAGVAGSNRPRDRRRQPEEADSNNNVAAGSTVGTRRSMAAEEAPAAVGLDSTMGSTAVLLLLLLRLQPPLFEEVLVAWPDQLSVLSALAHAHFSGRTEPSRCHHRILPPSSPHSCTR